MPKTRITREAIEALERQGITDRRDQAQALGVSVSGLDRARGRYGMREPRPDRSWIFEPWLPIADEDYSHTFAKYLRWVGQVADGEDVPAAQLNPAAKYLIALREEGLKYEYDRSLPKEARWFTVLVDSPEQAHEQTVLDKAIAARTRKRRQRRRNA